MWLEAIIPKEDLSAVVGELTPLTFLLGADGRLSLSEPSEVSLVEAVGLRAVCKAHVHWSVLGISVPVTLHSLAVLLRPEIHPRDGGPALVFRVEIEHADLAGVPDVIDDRVTQLLNHELETKHVELSWAYRTTLSHVFDLPEMLRPLERLAVTAGAARVSVTRDAAALAIEMTARVDCGQAMRKPAPASLTAGDTASPRPRGSARGSGWKRLALVGSLVTAALWGAFALGRTMAG
ncbi:MAG: hypothetical protein ACRELB_02790 [Polyangiaceae bacterium]